MAELEVTAEMHAAMARYCGGDPRVPREVSVEAMDEREGDWTLAEFQQLIADAVAKIPEEARAAARVELERGYEESTHLKITYRRMNTPEEVSGRIKRALEYVVSNMNSERATYERLKEKFGK